ncbi:hypothetical protein [Bdellovibrio sp. HCB337]|uniref:hypothetical protein n=1 Tax=Bdellovibrio sp. HCB337 TaxID=3394358 RepID=UPI0039A52493
MRLLAFLLGTLLVSSSAMAYLTISESAEIPAATNYQLGFEPQFLTNEGGGANATVFFDAPMSDSTSTRLWLGAGVIDFNVGATFKYVPFPDVDNQPGIGFRGGAFYARNSSENVLTLQVAPIFSKKVDTENGLFIPYAAVALDFTSTKEKNFTGSQIMFGTEYKTPEIPKMFFGLEAGFELNDSYSYISGTVTFPFDSSKGLFE